MKLAAISAAKSEVGPRGVRVNVVSPGWIYTSASDALVKRIVAASELSADAARQSIIDALGAFRWVARLSPKKWRN